MEKRVYKVEKPVYLKKEQINEQYWDKQVLLTNVEMTSDFRRMDGGIVRYYANDAKDELYGILRKLRETEGDDVIKSCCIEYIGDLHLNLYAAGGGNP